MIKVTTLIAGFNFTFWDQVQHLMALMFYAGLILGPPALIILLIRDKYRKKSESKLSSSDKKKRHLAKASVRKLRYISISFIVAGFFILCNLVIKSYVDNPDSFTADYINSFKFQLGVFLVFEGLILFFIKDRVYLHKNWPFIHMAPPAILFLLILAYGQFNIYKENKFTDEKINSVIGELPDIYVPDKTKLSANALFSGKPLLELTETNRGYSFGLIRGRVYVFPYENVSRLFDPVKNICSFSEIIHSNVTNVGKSCVLIYDELGRKIYSDKESSTGKYVYSYVAEKAGSAFILLEFDNIKNQSLTDPSSQNRKEVIDLLLSLKKTEKENLRKILDLDSIIY